MLRELEMLEAEARERPCKHLPDIPSGRREHVTFSEPPELHVFDESSMGVGAGAALLTHRLGQAKTALDQ